MSLVRTIAALFFVIAGFSQAAESPVIQGKYLVPPYLYRVDGNQIGISWQTVGFDSESARAPLFLLKEGQVVAVPEVKSSSGLSQAVLPLSTCGFGEGYSYQIGDDRYPIASNPCGNFTGTARFSFVADTQEGPEIAHQFALEIAKFPGSALIHGGDVVQTGSSYAEWVSYFQAMAPIGSSRILFPVVGNHEYRGDPAVPLFKAFFQKEAKQAHYAFDIGAAHILVLNSCFEDDPSQVESQLSWLRTELAKEHRWKIVVFHHPPYSKGFFNSPIAPKKEWRILQERYVPLFELFGVKLVLNGHTHIYERSFRNGVTYITAGPAGGKMGVVFNTNPYSVVLSERRTVTHFEVDSHAIRALTVDENGGYVDDVIVQ